MNFFHKSIKTIITLLFYLFDSLTLILTKIIYKKDDVGGMLLINLGALGDSVIFLNVLQQIKNKEKLSCLVDSNSKIIFDQNDINFYEINRKKYIKNIFYRTSINLRFSKYKFDKVINVRGSRNGIYEDSIIRFIDGQKYALETDYESNSYLSLKIFDYFEYHHLIKCDLNRNKHEIQRINILLNEVFGKKISLKILDLSNYFHKILNDKMIDKKYCVISVGAGKNFRKWDINKFIEIGNYIENTFDIVPVYCGLSEDNKNIKNSSLNMSKKSLNLCGKTSMSELINLIKYSSLNICNDSASAHLSVFFHNKTIIIKSEFQHERFLPYPTHLTSDNIEVLVSKNINEILSSDLQELINFRAN